MTDSIGVLPPGYQITNASGVVQAGAVLRFYDAGTSDQRTVLSDPTLETSLEVTVFSTSATSDATADGLLASTVRTS